MIWNKNKGISGNTLKIIAAAVMIIDHAGAAILYKLLIYGYIPDEQFEIFRIIYDVMRNIGRTAFPIYCFLLVEGLLHTSSKEKYAARLAIFAVLSEIPFDLAIHNGLTFSSQNVFFTLLIGLLMLWAMQKAENVLYQRFSGTKKRFLVILLIIWGILLFVGCQTAYLLKTDYSYNGIILIAIFYFLRANKILACLFGYLSFLWEAYCLPAFVLIMLYNGKRKKERAANKGSGGKYIFYFIYPVHLLLLYLLWLLLIH